jgi:hypothetical protein
VGVAKVSAKQIQGERVAFHLLHQRLELLLRARHPERAEQRHASIWRKAQEVHHRGGGLPIGAQVRDRIAGGDNAETFVVGGEPLEQGGEARVLEFARRGRGGRVLQRLQTIEDEQRPPLAGELGQPPAFVERALRTARHLRVAEEGEGFLQKHVGR